MRLTCRDVVEFLMDYDSNELPAGQRAEFERHLKACPPCVNFLHTYRTTVELEKESFSDALCSRLGEIPEDLVQAILNARRAK